jgi:hypothetical protein
VVYRIALGVDAVVWQAAKNLEAVPFKNDVPQHNTVLASATRSVDNA